MNEAVTLEHVNFAYKQGVTVLDDVSFQIAEGEIAVIAGPNGSGKTTLIKLLFDLLTKQKGEIKIFGEEHDLISVKKKILYLPSDNILPDFLTGREYINMMHKLYDKTPDAEAITRLADYYSMTKSLDELMEGYSHGMVKKAELIAAFSIRPQLVVIDETLNGIDIEAKEVSKVLIRKFKEKGGTVLVCTHDLELAEELGEHAILLYKGKTHREIDLTAEHDASLTEIFRTIINFREENYVI